MSEQASGQSSGIAQGITDLVAVLGVVAVTALVVGLNGPAVVRVPAVLLAVLVLPGYVCTVVLFPVDDGSTALQTTHGGITHVERGVLAIGLSLGIVALGGLLLDALVGRLTTMTLLATVVTITVGLVGAAAYRRRQVPPSMRYEPTLATTARRAANSRLREGDTLAVVLLVSVLFAGGAIAAPQLGGGSEGVTELSLLAESEDGSLQASDYPTEFTVGSGQPLSVAVSHDERTTVNYTIVGQLQRAQRGDNGTTVQERTRIATRDVRVDPGETHVSNETVTVGEPGSYRVVYLLYRGDPPANPRIENADREVHLWITVTEATG